MAQIRSAVAQIEHAQSRVSKAMKQPLFPASVQTSQYEDTLPVKVGFEGNRILVSAFMRFTGAVLIL